MLLCYKVANFIKQSYESDASFNEDPKNAAYFKGTENYRKLDECYQVGTLVMFGDMDMIKTFTSPHMLQILKSLEERITHDPSKQKYGPYDRLGQVYSLFVGHVTNTIGILAIFNNLDRECIVRAFKNDEFISKCRQLPNPSATINIELLAPKEAGAEHRVRVRLNDEYLKIREDRSSPQEEYLFSEFKAIVMKNVVSDWYKKCDIGYESQAEQIQEYDTKTLYFIYLITCFDACLLFLVLLILLRSVITRKSKKTLD